MNLKDQELDDFKPVDSSRLKEALAHLDSVSAANKLLPDSPTRNRDLLRDTIRFYRTDQNGIPQQLVDGDGQVHWRANSEDTGGLNTKPQGVAPGVQFSGAPALHQPLRAEGFFHDVETGLHCEQGRYYDPDLGRFLAQVPTPGRDEVDLQ